MSNIVLGATAFPAGVDTDIPAVLGAPVRFPVPGPLPRRRTA